MSAHYCRAFTDFALHVDFAAVQIDAALYNHETETRAWTVIDVMAAMEGVEKPLSIGFGNSNALVADGANNFCADAPNFEPHRPPRVRSIPRRCHLCPLDWILAGRGYE
jgi:hypothetical protein